MLTAKENMWETVKGGNPDRYVNQYEAIHLLFHPFMMHNPMAELGKGPVENAWGITNEWPEGTPGGFPIHTPEKIVIKDIENWKEYVKAPSLDFSQEEWDMFKEQYDAVDGTKAFKAPFVAPGLFEMTHHLSEITNALMNYMTNPDEMHDLIKYLTEFELKLAEGICTNLKPDAVFHHDDWGSQISTFLRPEMFEEFFVAPYKEIYSYYKNNGCDLVIHHSDSFAATLVPYMIEMGIDVWQGAMEDNNVPELVKQYGDKITFMGNINNASVDKDGWTPEDVYETTRKALEAIPMQQGFIPCITQGGPGSVFPGTYAEISKEIDRYNTEKFGFTQEQLEDARLEMQIMF